MTDPDSMYYVPDGNIKASSIYTSWRAYEARFARLHDKNLWWVAAREDVSPWIQADIGRPASVYGVRTQGDGGGRWVTKVKVSTFQHEPVEDESVGDFIEDTDGVVKVRRGLLGQCLSL